MKVWLFGIPESFSSYVATALNRRVQEHDFVAVGARDSEGSIIEGEHRYSEKCADAMFEGLQTSSHQLGHHEPSVCAISFWRSAEPFLKFLCFPACPIFRLSEREAYWLNKKKARAQVNKYAQDVQQQIGKIFSYLELLSIEIRKTNSSPLLLPLGHFSSTDLADEVENLFMPYVSELRGISPPKETKKLREVAGFKSSGAGNIKNRFEDSKGVTFNAPGRAKHGGFHLGTQSFDEHFTSCCLNAFYRLGCSISPGFHYDCERKNKDKFSGCFEGCHKQSVEVSRQKYLNIYPNNHIRLGSK